MSPTIRSKGGLPLFVGGMVAGADKCCECGTNPCWCPDYCQYKIEVVSPEECKVSTEYDCYGSRVANSTAPPLIESVLDPFSGVLDCVGEASGISTLNCGNFGYAQMNNAFMESYGLEAGVYSVIAKRKALGTYFGALADVSYKVMVFCLLNGQSDQAKPNIFIQLDLFARVSNADASLGEQFFYARTARKIVRIDNENCEKAGDRMCSYLNDTNRRIANFQTPLEFTLSFSTTSFGDYEDDLLSGREYGHYDDVLNSLVETGFAATFRITSRPSCGPCADAPEFSGTAGTTTNTHTFPSAPQCIWFEGYDARYTVKIEGNVVYDSEESVPYASRCVSKQDGETDIEVIVDASGPWRYTLCDECPPVLTLQPCCKRMSTVSCGDVEIRRCFSEGVLIDSIYSSPEELVCPNASDAATCPDGDCTSNGYIPAPSAPYNCLNGAFQDGAWVTVSGWSAYTGDRSALDADLLALYEEVESKVNQTFHVPFDCLGSSQVTLDLGAGESRDTRDCSGAHWFATVTVNLCARTASVAVYNLACFDSTDIQIDLGELTSLTVPCNSWTGCICEGYDDTIPINFFIGGGSVTVSSS